MNHLFRFMKGYLKIQISGIFIERFFNLCMLQNIILWNVTNESDEEKVLYISLSDFFCIKPLLKKTNVRVKILKKYGFPFMKQKFYHRKIYLMGFVFCLIILLYLSNFIWLVKLSGNSQLTQSSLIQLLNQNHTGYGCPKEKINCKNVEKIIRKNFPYLSWVSAKIEGTTLYICVKESYMYEDPIKDIQEKTPSDLVANASGIISSMVVRKGIPLKHIGDEVKKGDLLISGNIPIYEDDGTIRSYQYCESDGEVYIQKFVQFEKTFSKIQTKSMPEENALCRYWIKFGSVLIEPSIKKDKNIDYDIESSSHQLCLFSNFYLPVYYGKNEYFPLKDKKIIYTDEYAKNQLKKAYSHYEERLKEKGVQIIQKNVKIKQDVAKMTLTVNLEVQIPIMTRQKAIPKTISLQEE